MKRSRLESPGLHLIGCFQNPKMDGENNGKPYEQMDDLGGKTSLFLVQHPHLIFIRNTGNPPVALQPRASWKLRTFPDFLRSLASPPPTEISSSSRITECIPRARTNPEILQRAFLKLKFTLPKTNSSPLNIGVLPQKRRLHLPTLHFQVLLLFSFREGEPWKKEINIYDI